MAATAKKRKTVSSIRIDTNVRCLRIYPVADNRSKTTTIADLETVGIKLSREQTMKLAVALLAAAQVWDEVEITAWRAERRKADGTYRLTVTTLSP